MSYLLSTRLRVEYFLKKNNSDCSLRDIQFLGTNRPIIVWSSLIAIIHDLRVDKKIIITKLKVGNRIFERIKWKN